MPNPPHVNIPIVHSRHFPIDAAVDHAKAIQASGVADSLTVWDQMTFFAPPSLWTVQNSPLATIMPDIDSFPDPYLVLGRIAREVPGFGLGTTSDAVRRGPAELTQTLLTLAEMSGGPVTVQMGAGEIKQCHPFGHLRGQGLKRLEDTFRIFRKFMDSTEPISHEGHHWSLDRAWLGAARPAHTPQLWGLGGGPRMIDITTRYGDGFCTAAPFVWSSPDQAAQQIQAIRASLAQAGRDPDQFGFGLWWICLLHDDEDTIAATMRNDYIKWISTTMGRFNPNDWRTEGIEPPMGDRFHYASHMLPLTYSAADTADVLSRATPQVVAKAWHHGSPEEMATQIKPYLDAGVNWIQIVDFLPLTQPPEAASEGLARALELAALLKKQPGQPRSS